MLCPNCGSNLEGELIFDTFLKMYNDEERALKIAASYGATKTEGHWGRQIGLYSLEEDRTYAWRCPDCGHEWSRT